MCYSPSAVKVNLSCIPIISESVLQTQAFKPHSERINIPVGGGQLDL